MDQIGALVPIEKELLQINTPLPWPVFDAWGNLLCEAGTQIHDENELADLIEDGYREELLESSTPKEKRIEGQEVALPTGTQSQHFSQPSAKAESFLSPAAETSSELNKESIMLDLDSVRWHVGETFFLQVHDNANLRYTVKLIGYVKNKSILVTAPRIDGRGEIVRDGQTFIVRSFPGKKAYAFTASALKSVYTPHPYLHLSYPKIVRCTAIRQSSRASVKIIASVTVGNPEQTSAATINDLSMGGASGIVKRQIGKKNDSGVIKFKITTAGEDAYLTLPIIVRSVVDTENTEEFRYGFEFVNMTTQSKLILSSYVHQTLAEIE